MIVAGTITKIEGPHVWLLVYPEGGTCADCSCDKPSRVIKALAAEDQELREGDYCVVEANPVWSRVSGAFTIIGALGGAVAGWLIAPPGETSQALGSILGLFGGLALIVVAFMPFRQRQLARARKVDVSLHPVPSCST